MHDFIEKNSFGYKVNVIKPEKSFFDLCRKYKRLPSGQARFCTSDLKTRPIGKFIKDYMAKKGYTKGINAIGIRAEESLARSKKSPYQISKLSTKKLSIMEWYPIFNYRLPEVWAEIKLANQEPHKLYSQGFSRLSCVFCVFGRVEEHRLAAKMRPELFKKMAALERELGKTIRLKQVKGVKMNKYLDECYA
jgi:3'-phosphoadenosine 5'-phosphosulfate sulfotransferase (PAPS reductase)/FAD synthetase